MADWKNRIKETRTVRVEDIQPHPSNWRRHPQAQESAIRGLLAQVGIVAPVVAYESELYGGLVLLDGHLRQETGGEWPVVVLDVSDAEADIILASFDPITGLAEMDATALAELLGRVDMQAIEDDGLAGLLEELATASGANAPGEPVDAEPQIDRAEELRQKWQTATGQIWQLGNHRLMIADCTDDDAVNQLMGGDKINLAFTSPPYAEQRDYDKSSGFKPIPPGEYVDWFAGVSRNVETHLARDGSWFVNIKPAAAGLDTLLYVFDLVIAHVRQWGWHFVTEFCWERAGIPKQVVMRFKNQFEPIYQFSRGEFKFRPDTVRHESQNVPKARGKGVGATTWSKHQGGESIFMSGMQGTPNFEWFGDNVGEGLAYPGNRLPTFTSSHEALGHAAAFPVGLPEFFIKAYTDPADVVYEPFAGSGSTLMAAEIQGRKCRAVELSPSYSAIILERFATATGIAPVRIENAPAEAEAVEA